MIKPLLVRSMVGTMLAMTSGTITAQELSGKRTEHAEVRQVTPVTRLLRTPRQSCRDEEVIYVQPQEKSRNIVGTLLGAVLGGLAGNQIGNGDGQSIATGVGAAVGAYVGNRIQANEKSDNVFINTDRRCFTMIDMQEVLIGYDVRYRLKGKPEALVRTNYDPGKKIPVKGGKLVLDGKTRGVVSSQAAQANLVR